MLDRDRLKEWIPELACRRAKERAGLPGIKSSRAQQILAGAIVAQATMEARRLTRWEICPWALREGVMLERLTRSQMEDQPLLALTGGSAPGIQLTQQTRKKAQRSALHVVAGDSTV